MTAIRAEPAQAGQRPGLHTWTPTFVLFLAYLFTIVTGRLPVGTVVMVLAIASLFLQRATLRTPGFLGLFAAWTLWAALGYAVTRYPEVVGDSLTDRAKVVLVTLVAVNALRRWTQIHFFILIVLVSYVLFPARSTLVNYVHGYTLFGRAIGPFIYGNPNDLAAHTILVLGPALALWAGAPRGSPIRWIALASAPLLTLVIIVLRDVHHARRRAGRRSPTQAEALRWLQYALIGYLTAGVFGSFSRLAFLYVYLALLWCASRTTEGLGLATNPIEPPPSRTKGAPIGGTRGRGWFGSLSQSR